MSFQKFLFLIFLSTFLSGCVEDKGFTDFQKVTRQEGWIRIMIRDEDVQNEYSVPISLNKVT